MHISPAPPFDPSQLRAKWRQGPPCYRELPCLIGIPVVMHHPDHPASELKLETMRP